MSAIHKNYGEPPFLAEKEQYYGTLDEETEDCVNVIRVLAYPDDAQQGNDQRGELVDANPAAVKHIKDARRRLRDVEDSLEQAEYCAATQSAPHQKAASEQASPSVAPADSESGSAAGPAPFAARSAVEEVEAQWRDSTGPETWLSMSLRHARRLDALERAMEEFAETYDSVSLIRQRAAQIEKEFGNG